LLNLLTKQQNPHQKIHTEQHFETTKNITSFLKKKNEALSE